MLRGTEEVARGTGRVVVGTGNLVVGGGRAMLEGTGRAARRITSIFTPLGGGGLIDDEDLKDQRAHLRHIETPSNHTTKSHGSTGSLNSLNRIQENPVSPRKSRSANKKVASSLSPKREKSSRRHTSVSPKRSNGSRKGVPQVSLTEEEEDGVIDELAEMERFMLHMQGLDPEQVKEALSAT